MTNSDEHYPAAAADRLEQIAAQLRSSSFSLGGPKVDVANLRTKLNSKAKRSQTNSSLNARMGVRSRLDLSAVAPS